MKIKLFATLIMLLFPFFAKSQDVSEQMFENDSVILNRIEQWQDLKFGFMVHWGIYTQWETVESWSICNEPWINRNGVPYNQYVEEYEALNTTFNPVDFNPEYWAELAQTAGMKYVVFTTKHHDGFCLFDSKYTDYTSTHESCAFHDNENADITDAVVKAFRDKDFWIGLYFSKADWNHDDYWAPEWATPDRNVNYNPVSYPERWQSFCDFTYNQIEEITHNYGDIDILWLDGGWIRPEWSLTDESREWIGCKQWIQDINMGKIAKMARNNNPNLIIVDRTVHGKYENYRTPEQLVPDSILPYPWETCMSMGDSWSYVGNDNYKSVNKLIHILVDVVAKGGNYLLNVGPDKNGNLHPTAVHNLKQIGEWMRVNGDAIYGTRPVYPYCDGKIRFTQNDNGDVNVFYLLDEDEQLPDYVDFKCSKDIKPGNKKVLGANAKVKLEKRDDCYRIYFNKMVKKNYKNAIVICC